MECGDLYPEGVQSLGNEKVGLAVDVKKHYGRPLTSKEMGSEEFVNKFFSKSRLHYIGTWKTRYEEFIGTLDWIHGQENFVEEDEENTTILNDIQIKNEDEFELHQSMGDIAEGAGTQEEGDNGHNGNHNSYRSNFRSKRELENEGETFSNFNLNSSNDLRKEINPWNSSNSIANSSHSQYKKVATENSVVFHVDMDCFFCAVSLITKLENGGDKSLQQMPCAVCWPGGEISSCNYIARSFGVKAGMSFKKAKALCPKLYTLEFDFERYSIVAEKVYRELFRISPKVIGVSVDEAYVDVSHLVQHPIKENSIKLAQKIRKNIFDVTNGCTASIGIGPNRLISRFATKKAKPDGVCFVKDAEEFNSISMSCSVRDLPGIGYRTEEKLNEMGIQTCEDLAKLSISYLESSFGVKTGRALHDLSHGIDSRAWDPLPKRKSIGAQISWGVRMTLNSEVKSFIDELCKQVVQRLQQANKVRGGTTIGFKLWRAVESAPDNYRKGSVGHGICTIVQRSAKLTHPSGLDSEKMAKVVFELYNGLGIEAHEIRGMGISISNLVDSEDKYGSLDNMNQENEHQLNKKQKTLTFERKGRISSFAAGKASVYTSKDDSDFEVPLNEKEDNQIKLKNFIAKTRYYQQQTRPYLVEKESEIVSKMRIDEMKKAIENELTYSFEYNKPITNLENSLKECHRLLRAFGNELQRRGDFEKKEDLIGYCEFCLEHYNPEYLLTRKSSKDKELEMVRDCYIWFKEKVIPKERAHHISSYNF